MSFDILYFVFILLCNLNMSSFDFRFNFSPEDGNSESANEQPLENSVRSSTPDDVLDGLSSEMYLIFPSLFIFWRQLNSI